MSILLYVSLIATVQRYPSLRTVNRETSLVTVSCYDDDEDRVNRQMIVRSQWWFGERFIDENSTTIPFDIVTSPSNSSEVRIDRSLCTHLHRFVRSSTEIHGCHADRARATRSGDRLRLPPMAHCLRSGQPFANNEYLFHDRDSR